ncbi:MAG TPA: hypothetical protein VGP45_01490 [Marinobacter sp.]|nr:hypothetical protein [Marinobacter sp.]
MAYDLEDVDILELSLVDTPANQHASVVLFKRFGYTDGVNTQDTGETEKGDGSVTVEELTQKLEALQAQVTDLMTKAEEAEAAKAAAEAAVDEMTKSAEDAGLEIEDGKIVKRSDPDYVEIDGEKVEKSAVPAPVLRAIEKQAAEMADLKKQAAEVELAKRGEAELPNLAGTALAKGRLLAAVSGDEEMLKSLKAADAAMAESYTEKGAGDVHNDASPSHKLDQLAKAHAAAQNVSFEVAYSEVTKAGVGADLLSEIRNQAN